MNNGTTVMYWKLFYYKNSLEIIIIQECIGTIMFYEIIVSDFTIEIYW